MDILIVLLSVIFWAVFRRALGGWRAFQPRWPMVALCVLASLAASGYVASLYLPPLWAALAATLFAAAVTLYWVMDHEPEGPLAMTVCRYMGPFGMATLPVGFSWAVARAVWRPSLSCMPMRGPSELAELLAGGLFGLSFGLVFIALI